MIPDQARRTPAATAIGDVSENNPATVSATPQTTMAAEMIHK